MFANKSVSCHGIVLQIDDVFKQCEEPMKLIEGTILEYTRTLIIFQRSCCIADLTPSTRSSIEECIMALKEVTVDSKENSGMKVCLWICEDIIWCL